MGGHLKELCHLGLRRAAARSAGCSWGSGGHGCGCVWNARGRRRSALLCALGTGGARRAHGGRVLGEGTRGARHDPSPAGRAVRGAPALAFRAAPRPCPRANVPSPGTVAHCSPARPGLGAAPPDLHALQSQRVKVRSAPRYSSPGGGPPGPPRQALCVSARPAGPPATCQPGPQRRRPSPMLIKLAGPAAAPRSFPPTLPTPPGLWGCQWGPGRLCLSALASPRPPNLEPGPPAPKCSFSKSVDQASKDHTPTPLLWVWA